MYGRFLFSLLLTISVLLLGPSILFASPYVYLTFPFTDSVAVIDVKQQRMLGHLSVGDAPYEVVVSPDNRKAYVANYHSGTISVIDNKAMSVIDTVAAGERPYALEISPDGKKLYVTNTFVEGFVNVLDTSTLSVIDTIPVGNQPYGIAVSSDSSRVYVSNFRSDTVSVIDTARAQVTATVPVGHMPMGVAVSAPHGDIYVTNSGSSSVSVIDPETLIVVATIPVGSSPTDVVTTLGKAYVINSYGFSVSIIDTQSLGLADTIGNIAFPWGATLTPGGKELYIATTFLGRAAVVETATDTQTGQIAVGGLPFYAAAFELRESIEVVVDVKPGNSQNPVNPGLRGLLPVAILSTSTAAGEPWDLDARDVDPDSVLFGPLKTSVAHAGGHLVDLEGDGDLDLLMHFNVQEAGLSCGMEKAPLEGVTYDGTAISGFDTIRTVGCR